MLKLSCRKRAYIFAPDEGSCLFVKFFHKMFQPKEALLELLERLFHHLLKFRPIFQLGKRRRDFWPTLYMQRMPLNVITMETSFHFLDDLLVI